MKNIFWGLAAVAMLATSCKQGDSIESGGDIKSELDSVSYSIGVSIGSRLKRDDIKEMNYNAVAKGIKDALEKDSGYLIPEEMQMTVIQNYFNKMQELKYKDTKGQAQKFMEDNKSKEGVKETPTGLQYIVIKEGSGEKPTSADTVEVFYHGTLTDGTVFDSAKERGQSVTFAVNGVVPGFSEALKLMTPGSIYKVFIPYELAYGEQGNQVIPPYSVLIFEIEMLKVIKGSAM